MDIATEIVRMMIPSLDQYQRRWNKEMRDDVPVDDSYAHVEVFIVKSL